MKFGGDTDENFCCAFEYFNGRGRVVVDTLTLLDYYGWRYGFTRCFLKSVSSIVGVYESECFLRIIRWKIVLKLKKQQLRNRNKNKKIIKREENMNGI